MKLPQLSLRELFLLVALVAMGCGWWIDHRDAIAWQEHWRTRYWKAQDELNYANTAIRNAGMEIRSGFPQLQPIP
jgi:hypothetical protein